MSVTRTSIFPLASTFSVIWLSIIEKITGRISFPREAISALSENASTYLHESRGFPELKSSAKNEET